MSLNAARYVSQSELFLQLRTLLKTSSFSYQGQPFAAESASEGTHSQPLCQQGHSIAADLAFRYIPLQSGA